MASLADSEQVGSSAEGTRFFTIMAVIMSLLIIVGFSTNIAMGRSSFSAAWPYHLHGVIFMGWVGLYMAQHLTIASGNRAQHRRMGRFAYAFIPAMFATGLLIMITSVRSTGGLFFFAINEFLIGNLAVLLCFAGLAWAALKARRNTGWHRRLMLCSMAVLTGPAIGRLLPLPLVMPYSWMVATLPCLIFPVIGMVADKRSSGTIHPAYWWGSGAYFGALAIAFVLSYTPVGYAITEWVVAGSAGAERPVEAFLPPDFSM